jgi:hypothetical protein
MVSMGVDSEEVPPQMWGLVWRRQLRLAEEEEFWKGLRGEDVHYEIPPAPESPRPLPAYLTRFLRDTLHLQEQQIEALTRDEAQQLLDAYYARELREPSPGQ